MKSFFFKLFLLFIAFALPLSAGTVEYPPFVAKQMQLIKKINDVNATKESIKEVLKEQDYLYSQAVNDFMSSKSKYINNIDSYENEIFSLKKIMSINQRLGNTNAVLRDEVALKSYEFLRIRKKILKNILLALDSSTLEQYELKLSKLLLESSKEIESIYKKDYKYFLNTTSKSKIVAITKENIENFYTLQDLHSDMTGYLYKYASRMYRLNKYAKYHLISFAIYINSIDGIHTLNFFLEEYGLSVLKLLFIFLLIFVIYFFRTIVYVWLEQYFLKIDMLKAYSEDILSKLRRPIESLIIIININMVIFVYDDFSSNELVSQIFNIIYGFYFTLFMYKIVNTVASVKLSKIDEEESNVQKDLVNVGIKIINFIIVIIGVLIALFFAGVNLTAVLSGLGIGGFAVAFAAKDTISNFFGTLSILFSDVFSQGDWIEIDGKEGVVVEIGLRVTTIRTFDNALIAMPNGTFASKDVKNWNKRILGRRIKMNLGVKYDSKREDIQNAIVEIREMLTKHSKIATKDTKYTHRQRRHKVAKIVSKDDLEGVKHTLLVYLSDFSDSSINILVYCFSKSVNWEEWLATKEDVMHKIMEIFEKNNIEFAFPSLSLYHENNTNEIGR